MANYDDHIRQSQSNLEFLGSINNHFPERYDWQVTVAFYTSVHIVNAHLAKTQDMHFRSHEEVKNAISPTTQMSPCRIDETPYMAYDKLFNCSRRARYLICDDPGNREVRAFFTSEKYLARAIRHLDIILSYFSQKYGLTYPPIHLKCPKLKEEKLIHFKITS